VEYGCGVEELLGNDVLFCLEFKKQRESIMMNIRPKLKNLILDSKVSGLNTLVLFEEFKCKYLDKSYGLLTLHLSFNAGERNPIHLTLLTS
jgi:hypothetical protein